VPSRALKPADRTRSVLRNTAVVALAQLNSIFVSLLLAPYILNRLGIERFGLSAFLGAIVAFAGLFISVSVAARCADTRTGFSDLGAILVISHKAADTTAIGRG
jgi:hypothetical protein